MTLEERKPFWNRSFPQLYRCKECGAYSIMPEPQPWAGHLCNLPPNIWIRGRYTERERSKIIREAKEGKYEFIAEGEEAKKKITELRIQGANIS